MLPNHTPLLIAEQFGTLAALHPGRVELGLGRAPGSDQITARLVRRALLGGADEFPRDVVELMGYFQPAGPGQAVQAVPGRRATYNFSSPVEARRARLVTRRKAPTNAPRNTIDSRQMPLRDLGQLSPGCLPS
jgi:alkanesulfonate monooxygenase SsuD/methylene tetrahydromethanopterin reductase-like flavin-dependent oxidoreductase (luciferase family)